MGRPTIGTGRPWVENAIVHWSLKENLNADWCREFAFSLLKKLGASILDQIILQPSREAGVQVASVREAIVKLSRLIELDLRRAVKTGRPRKRKV